MNMEVFLGTFYGGFCDLSAGALQILGLGPGNWADGREC